MIRNGLEFNRSRFASIDHSIALFQKAREAEDRFQKALVMRYGKDAGDVRYQPYRQTPMIRRLGDEFKACMEAWRVAVREAREKEADHD